MDLKNFIKETIIQIAESVIEVQEHFNNNNIDSIINPREMDKNYNSNYPATYSTISISPQGQSYAKTDVPRTVDNIEFDVAITTEIDSEKGVGGKLKIFDVGIGANASEINKLANVSKVRFKIPIVLPHGKENNSTEPK